MPGGSGGRGTLYVGRTGSGVGVTGVGSAGAGSEATDWLLEVVVLFVVCVEVTVATFFGAGDAVGFGGAGVTFTGAGAELVPDVVAVGVTVVERVDVCSWAAGTTTIGAGALAG
ncbi:hypothetical protein [Terrabacter terrae]|uniref:hypothetical protein n=1 Tax=Terrabacter terrae TaxID=318434 RepID=UPI0031D73A94